MRKLFIPILIVALIATVSCTKKSEFKLENQSQYVDPLIGTDFHGHTYPGATVPFGMIQLSPDTRLEGWDGCSGFHYSDSVIYGFSHTHLSGTGCSDYGDILLIPVDEYSTPIKEKRYTSVFDRKTEIAKAGFYAVNLKDFNIDVELTASQRVGFHKYTYPDKNSKIVVLNFEHRDEVAEAWVEQVSATRLVGLRHSKAWAANQYAYFVIDFSEPVDVIDNVGEKSGERYSSKDCKLVLKSKSNETNELLVKVALSGVSEKGAIANIEKEIPGWNFEEIKENAITAWNKELSKILVSGGTKEQQIIFYTALYHTFIAPNIYSDVDGSYRSTDLNVYNTKEYNTYTVFSLWDTYRAAHPLYTITQQEKTLDFIKTFLDQYKYGGQLPVWELSANETQCMIGYHSVPVIVDAYFKGIKNFDTKLALEAMVASAVEKRLGKPEFSKYGYIPMDLEHESVSKTLEYAFDDWCIAMFAKAIGNEDVYNTFIQRAQYYKNILNPNTGFMQAKINGAWQTPFDPKEVNYNFTEANSWQYSFYVPQDILTLIELHGGNDKFVAKIDQMFSEESQTTGNNQADVTGLIGQYAHGNEPSHHAAYLYNYAGHPWKTQEIVRKIMNEQYSEKPDGLCGNEDCGQMSAWYVMSSLGFYPTNPAAGIYDFGSPLFDTVIIQMENGNSFTVIAHNNSAENIYIQSVKLNGQAYEYNYIKHEDISKGGKLEFFMGAQPNTERGTDIASIYNSKITDKLITPVPFANYAAKSFHDSIYIELDCIDPEAVIYYSLNNEAVKEYSEPILLSANAKITAHAEAPNKITSKTVECVYTYIPDRRTIKLLSRYSNQYSIGGPEALIDNVKGQNWYKSGTWQGYQGQEFGAIIDLLEVKPINDINVSFLQETRAWIFFPPKVTFYASNDGTNFTKIYEGENKMSYLDEEVLTQNFQYLPQNLKARYIKVVGDYYGKLPDWHISAGETSWLFVDEIEIK
jgi:predicted alpha-1,2-mannosidase